MNQSAFPRNNHTYPNGEVEYGDSGMSLRQWYKGQAMVGILASCSNGSDAVIVKAASVLADAMIEEDQLYVQGLTKA